MTSKKIGVLIFPAGEINSIELHDALSVCVNIRLFGASSVDRHGEFVFKNYIPNLPKIQEQDFILVLNRIIEQNQIDVIIPTHDDVVLFLAENQQAIHAKILTADVRTATVCRDKQETYALFSECDFCPQVYDVPMNFPVFMKPRKGQGGVGVRLLSSADDIPADMDISDHVFCEYLPGEELTVDCFTDKDGVLQAVLPRSRKRIFGGVSVRTQREAVTKEIFEIAEKINSRLSFLGLWYFQLKQGNDGRYKLLEISVRCAGSMCLSRTIGVNLPLLSVYALLGKKTEILANDYTLMTDRTLISRYKTDLKYNCVYVDLDDTILINDEVDLQTVRFLYQCVNQHKRLILLTRHRVDHDDSAADALRKHRIAPELFDDIIELDSKTPKYTKINPEGAIFIDNAFAERKAVYENLGIPVFDVDGIEMLLDWRK